MKKFELKDCNHGLYGHFTSYFWHDSDVTNEIKMNYTGKSHFGGEKKTDFEKSQTRMEKEEDASNTIWNSEQIYDLRTNK